MVASSLPQFAHVGCSKLLEFLKELNPAPRTKPSLPAGTHSPDDQADPKPAVATPMPRETDADTTLKQMPKTTATPPESRKRLAVSVAVSKLGDLAVMRMLYSKNLRTSTKAKRELLRRGFTEAHLRLAEQLVHPNVQVRLNLVDSLLRLQGSDPRPWLIWLSRDHVATVRKQVIAVMASGNDPSFRSRLREMHDDEVDPEVRLLLTRISNNGIRR